MAILLLSVSVLAGCTPLQEGDGYHGSMSAPEIGNRFTTTSQVHPPPHIRSIQLYREGSPSHPPVIRLPENETLVLEFDHLGSVPKQFKASVHHYSSDWRKSSLAPNFFVEGFYEETFGSGEKSYVQRPTYRHYEYRFPNRNSSVAASGNYLLAIQDVDSGELLFSLPFFVSEDEGELQTRAETLYAQQNNLRELDRLFSVYRYPAEVELPQFDLSFAYVQNRFWGRMRTVRQFDTSTPGAVNFRLTRDEAFPGDYEFRTVDLRSLFAGGRILSFQPEFTPPKIILRRDIQRLSPPPAFTPDSRFGQPIDDRNSQYADVQFRLDAGRSDTLQKIYLVGDFNGWSIGERNRMRYNPANRLWEGSAFIKQGEYAYKYVILKENRIDDLALDRSFTFRRQNYITLVYFRDPTRHYDRLLKVDEIRY